MVASIRALFDIDPPANWRYRDDPVKVAAYRASAVENLLTNLDWTRGAIFDVSALALSTI